MLNLSKSHPTAFQEDVDAVNAKIAERKARKAAAAGAAAVDAEDQSLFEPSNSLLICSNRFEYI